MALRSPHPAEDLKGIVRLASHRHYLSGTGARLPFTVGAAGGHGEFRLRNLLSATLPPNRFQRYRLTWTVPGKPPHGGRAALRQGISPSPCRPAGRD